MQKVACTGCSGGKKQGNLEILCSNCLRRFNDAERLQSIAHWKRDPRTWARQKRGRADRSVEISLENGAAAQ